jgi:hypothetical protein
MMICSKVTFLLVLDHNSKSFFYHDTDFTNSMFGVGCSMFSHVF